MTEPAADYPDALEKDLQEEQAAFTILRSRGFLAFLCTLFLGAFNDNVFKLLISLFAVRTLLNPQQETAYVTLAAGLFTLPFLLFSPYAGCLADRFSKKRIMVWVKAAEILIMLAGVAAFAVGSLRWLLLILFCMGSQSAFFSPAKYGFLPEVLPDEVLSRGNGAVQLWTFVAIIIGGALGGQLSQTFAQTVYLAAACCVLIAVLGFLTSLGITPTVVDAPRLPAPSPATPAAATSDRQVTGPNRGWVLLPLVWSGQVLRLSVVSVVATLRDMRNRGYLLHCLLGTMYFWFLGALFQVNILFYAKGQMQASDRYVGLLQAAVALGMGLGSLLAGRCSGGKIEFGLVPFGALAMSGFAVALGFSVSHPHWTLGCAALLGTSAGFYNIPLAAYIQQQSPPEYRGRYMAANNLLTFASMTLSYPFLWFLRGPLGLTAAQVFCMVGVVTALVLLALLRAIPDMFIRAVLWLGLHTLYRIDVTGRQHAPTAGGGLIVCNHVSLLDGALLKIALQRPVRFLIHRSYYDKRWLNPFLRQMGAIPIAAGDGPGALKASLRAASDCLAAGDLVCLFPEGRITRTGQLQDFNRGMESLLRGIDVPVIPACIEGFWQSVFSRAAVRPPWHRIWRRRRVRLLFGQPLPPDLTAAEARAAVAGLCHLARQHAGNTPASSHGHDTPSRR